MADTLDDNLDALAELLIAKGLAPDVTSQGKTLKTGSYLLQLIEARIKSMRARTQIRVSWLGQDGNNAGPFGTRVVP